jgi:protein SCO1/2
MWWWFACATEDPTYPVTGEVIELRPPSELVIAHEEIPGFMEAMTMPFTLADPADLSEVGPGDKVAGTLVVGKEGTRLHELQVTQKKPVAEEPPALAPGQSVPEGAIFPSTPVMLAEGSPITLGQGQEGRWAVTFIYTRCPVPEFCPAVVSRLQALQPALLEAQGSGGARILAITLDPEYDSRGVLREFAAQVGAKPGVWDFGKVPGEVLFGLAEKAGLKTAGEGLGIVHDLVLLVLDEDGRLIKRYHDMKWDQDEVVKLLSRGTP